MLYHGSLWSNCWLAVFVEHLLCTYASASLSPAFWELGFFPLVGGRRQGDADNNPPTGVTPTDQALFSLFTGITLFNLLHNFVLIL